MSVTIDAPAAYRTPVTNSVNLMATGPAGMTLVVAPCLATLVRPL